MQKFVLALLLVTASLMGYAQDDLLSLVQNNDTIRKERVTNAFKSTRVINGHSMEFLGKGVLDFRILHRFGEVSDGISNLFGLDQASMRIGLDYGVFNNLTVGFGRSNVGKELDGFIKFCPVWQTSGPGSFPFSIVLVSGVTLNTQSWSDTTRKNYFSSRMAFYNELILGRKFSERFSLQLSPVFVHRNLVELASEENDVYALGIGARFKLTKRIAFVADYHYIVKGLDKDIYKDPLSVGFDIETGGHVFQLHFSNATGMNEKAFITNTTGDWGKGEVRFGFNLSRVFTVSRPRH
jgi:opacity protein-like surface antigen